MIILLLICLLHLAASPHLPLTFNPLERTILERTIGNNVIIKAEWRFLRNQCVYVSTSAVASTAVHVLTFTLFHRLSTGLTLRLFFHSPSKQCSLDWKTLPKIPVCDNDSVPAIATLRDNPSLSLLCLVSCPRSSVSQNPRLYHHRGTSKPVP